MIAYSARVSAISDNQHVLLVTVSFARQRLVISKLHDTFNQVKFWCFLLLHTTDRSCCNKLQLAVSIFHVKSHLSTATCNEQASLLDMPELLIRKPIETRQTGTDHACSNQICTITDWTSSPRLVADSAIQLPDCEEYWGPIPPQT